MDTIAEVSYAAILTCAFLSAKLYKNKSRFKLPVLTITLSVVLTVLFLLQLLFPNLLFTFERNAPEVFSGQLWRIFTSILFQDGGIIGAVFNIISLLIIGGLAEQLWKRKQWLLIFFLGYVIASIVALFWQPIGAGNSIANFSLAGSLLLVCLTTGKKSLVKSISIVGILLSIGLCLRYDIHGVAILGGAIISYLLISNGKNNSRNMKPATIKKLESRLR